MAAVQNVCLLTSISPQASISDTYPKSSRRPVIALSRTIPLKLNTDNRSSSWHSARIQAANSDDAIVGDSGWSEEHDHVELPLFPLPLVLFPGSILPLHIFEFRYRILVQTLLQTDLRFGIVYTGKQQGTAAAIGCVGEIIKYEKLQDDRYFLICRGQERFRVIDIVRTRPYLVAKVAWLEDRPSVEAPGDSSDVQTESGPGLGSESETEQVGGLEGLANEVEVLMKDVIRLSNKMSGRGGQDTPEELDLRKASFPTPFSFWVASTFEGAPSEQQSLLELEDTAERLRRERQTLRNTLNYLTAATAVKDVFTPEPE